MNESGEWLRVHGIGLFRAAISGGALLAIVVHVWKPDLAIDAVTLGLFGVALVPWIGVILKSVEIPGVIKLEWQVRDSIQKAQAPSSTQAEKAVEAAAQLRGKSSISVKGTVEAGPPQQVGGGLHAETSGKHENGPSSIATGDDIALSSSDPREALIRVSYDIERSLSRLTGILGIRHRGQSLPSRTMVDRLRKAGALEPEFADALEAILVAGRQAVHGGRMTKQTAAIAVDDAPYALTVLKQTEQQLIEALRP